MIALSHPALHRHSQMNAKVTCLSRNTPTEPLYSHHRHHDLSITIRGKGKKKKIIIIKRKEKRNKWKASHTFPLLFIFCLSSFLSFFYPFLTNKIIQNNPILHNVHSLLLQLRYFLSIIIKLFSVFLFSSPLSFHHFIV